MLRICSKGFSVANTAYAVKITGPPNVDIPAAIPTASASAIPTDRNLEGYRSLKAIDRVDLDTSAVTTTSCGNSSPIATKASPRASLKFRFTFSPHTRLEVLFFEASNRLHFGRRRRGNELMRHPFEHDFLCELGADHSGAHRQNIRVVAQPCAFRGERVMTCRRIDPLEFVRGYRHADPCSAQQDALPCEAASLDFRGYPLRNERIDPVVFLGVCTDILIRHVASVEKLHDCLLERERSIVGSDQQWLRHPLVLSFTLGSSFACR